MLNAVNFSTSLSTAHIFRCVQFVPSYGRVMNGNVEHYKIVFFASISLEPLIHCSVFIHSSVVAMAEGFILWALVYSALRNVVDGHGWTFLLLLFLFGLLLFIVWIVAILALEWVANVAIQCFFLVCACSMAFSLQIEALLFSVFRWRGNMSVFPDKTMVFPFRIVANSNCM